MAVNCVFPSKKQAESLGITEGQLRNILQEYTNSPELQSQFTEEEFIDSKLNGLPVIGVSDAQMQAWEEVYPAPQEFDNIDDYNEAASTAEAIFGRNAIGHRETPEGKHILSVANPYTESMIKERLEIKEKTIADGTFMKAPNGNPTNLSERQWLQVRTKEFKDWFGDWENDPENASKVVDENGEPLVVYHGTPNGEFSIFSYDYIHPDDGFYFAEDEDRADTFTYRYLDNTNPYLFDVFLNIRKPMNLGDNVIHETVRTAFTTEYVLGSDGVMGLDSGTNHPVWVVMRPNQIKSADKNIGSFSRKEDDILYLSFGKSKEPSGETVTKGKLGVNKEQLITLLGSTMYQSGRQEVAVKELMQNAFDAVKIAKSQGLISRGKIDVDIDKDNRTVRISDNGTGMTPEIVQKAFFTIGGSYKGEGVDNRLKSGGLGLAKMAFLFGSDYVDVTTIKDGVKTHVRATPEEIQNDNFDIVTSKTKEPNGTSVEVKIPEVYYDQNGEKRAIWFSRIPDFLARPMMGDVDVTVVTDDIWDQSGKKISTYDKSVVPEGYTSIGKASTAFGDIEVYIAPEDNGYSSISSDVLISGLHQFTNNTWLEHGNKARYKAIINILPSVGVADQLYPMNNQREGFRSTISAEVKDLEFLLKRINSILEKKSINQAFGRTISMDSAQVADVKRITPKTKEEIFSEVKKEIVKEFGATGTKPGQPNALDWGTIRTKKVEAEKSRTSSFDASGIKINEETVGSVDTSSLDLSKPVFHNNTTMEIGEDGQQVITKLGELMLELKSLFTQTYKDAGITAYNGSNITDYIAKQYWGISFDRDYGGVNVSPSVMNLLAINPFYKITQYKGVDTALALTEYITHLIKHEFNHNYARSENAAFTGRFPQTDAEFAGIGAQFNKEWKNKLYLLIKDNLQTFVKYAEKYRQATNIGESFKGNSLREGTESQEGSIGDDGRNLQGNPVGENVQGHGGEFDSLINFSSQESKVTFNPEGYEFYSGGAIGSDRAWSDAAKKALGVNTKHFTVDEYDALPQDEKDIIEREYKEVVFYLSRKELDPNSYSGKLVRRDMMQADSADAIFAIVNKLDSGYPTGGTAYAVVRGTRRGIPVYIFDKSKGIWKEYHYPTQTYMPTYTPVLTKKAAIIGTRQLGKDGRAAINQVIENTINTPQDFVEEEQGSQNTENTESLLIRKDLVEGYNNNLATLNGLNALRNNDVGLTDSEIDYEARQMSYWISDNVTDIERNPELMYDKFGVAKTNDWATEADKQKDIKAVSNMSRRQIISKITLNKFKEVYNNEILVDNPAIDDLTGRDAEKLPVLSENINALFDLALSTFSQSEGFTIKHNVKLGVDEVQDNDGQTAFVDDEPVDIAQLEEQGIQLEDWMIDKEAMEILGTASAKVRAALSQAFEVDAEGKDKVDYLGRRIRLSQNDAVKSIIRWTQGSQNIHDMIVKLDEKANTHPWLIQILERLEDTDNETDFISQFYSTFQKHFIFFDIVRKNKEQKYYFMDVNNRPALNNALEEMLVNYQLNESPMFTPTGWNDTNLNWFKRIVEGLRSNNSYNATEEQFNASKKNFVKVIKAASGLLGYQISEEDVNKSVNYGNIKSVIDALGKILDTFNQHQNNDGSYNPFIYSRKKNSGSVRGYLRDFLEVITESVEDTMESAFYEAGKMRQSYQLPTYATKLFGKLRGDEELLSDTLDAEFKRYKWFYNNGEWRNSMLRDLENASPEQRKALMIFKRSLKFGNDQYMRGLSPERYALSVLTEFGVPRNVDGMPISFYRLPIQSNKTHPDFMSFYRYTGDFYKASILDNLLLTFGQELSRIQTVYMRNRKKGDVDFIKNFDEARGRQFCFLDFLNDLDSLVNSIFTADAAKEMQGLIDAKIRGERVNDVRLNALAQQAIESGLNMLTDRTIQRFEELGIMDSIKNIDGVIDDRLFVENFVWNDTLANINISQLLITDLAYYEGSDDFQKRFAQIGAPGVRGNEFAVAYKMDGAPNMYAMRDGRVSDGKIRITFLDDFKSFKANMIENLEVILDRNIEQASTSAAKSTLKALKNSILSSMRKINVTDGQALISPTSARKFGYIYGKWSREQEQRYERVTRGDYSFGDLVALTNVRKPFIYTQLSQDVNTEDAPLDNIKMGIQIKDSEYMLALAGALLRTADTGRPNLLKVLYEVMKESAFSPNGVDYNGKGIDIFAFNSTVKTGLSGSSDVSTRWANEDYTKGNAQKAEAELKEYLLKQVYMTDRAGNLTRNYNPFLVKEIPVEDYATQVENPFHATDAMAIWSSQMRSILESNLEYADYGGNPVLFSWTDSNGNEHSVTRDDFKKEYEKNAAQILDIYIDRIAEEFGLDVQIVDENGEIKSLNHFLSNVDTKTAIALALQDEIKGNIERYGPDMLYACTIKDGVFTLPPGDPTQSKRIAQLINSIVKNRLNKPKVDGGMTIQVSSFGMSDQLHIRFLAKDGKTLLPTKDEWLKTHPNGDYWEYCRENQGGVAYEENYAPAHMGEFFKYFKDSRGNVDVEAIEMLDENLLYSIDERTPTEFYYSIATARIKDFLPADAGDGGMRPYEITEIDDSDFDNDKRTKWFLSAQILRNKIDFGVDELIAAVPALQAMSPKAAKGAAREFLRGDKFQKSKDATDPALFRAMKEAYVKANFTVQYPTEGEKALLNNQWRMSRAVLQSESTAAKLLSPGGNADLAKFGYASQLAATTGMPYDNYTRYTVSELEDMVKKTDSNLMFFINQMEYYQRNNDASSNLGIFAVAATSHNLLEGQGYALNNEEEFTIAGKHFGYYVELDPMRDADGMLVSKSLGSNVSGAADAAKVPSHGYLNINGNTINEYLVLLRTGLPEEKAAVFIATLPIKNLVSQLRKSNVAKNTTNMKTLLENRINELKVAKSIKEDSPIYREELSWREIKNALNSETLTPEIELKVLLAFQRVGKLTEGMRAATFPTRYNSVASAVGPLETDNLIHKHQVEKYRNSSGLSKIEYIIYDARENNAEKTFGETIVDKAGKTVVLTPDNFREFEEQGLITVEESVQDANIDTILNDHIMLQKFSMGYDIADMLFNALEMPLSNSSFKNMIDVAGSIYSEFFYTNKEALNKLGDFYLSYLLVQSGIINSDPNAKQDGPQYYMRQFPKDFLKVRDKYKGNALIDAIRPKIDNDVVSLELSTSGMKIDKKTELQSAWVELYNTNERLALALFRYNFWKGGLGFSPRTFMNLVPSRLKSKIDGYNRVFTKNSLSVSSVLVMDQFFRNNAKDNNIVRFISEFKKEGQFYNRNTGELTFRGSWFNDLKKSPFIKFKDGARNIRLFRITRYDEAGETLTYKETSALGNNGEFIEMSNNDIQKSFVNSKIEDTSDVDNTTTGTDTSYYVEGRTEEQMRKEAEEYAAYFRDPHGNMLKTLNGEDIDAEDLISYALKFKKEANGKYSYYVETQRENIKAIFDANGIKYDENKIEEILRKLC